MQRTVFPSQCACVPVIAAGCDNTNWEDPEAGGFALPSYNRGLALSACVEKTITHIISMDTGLLVPQDGLA